MTIKLESTNEGLAVIRISEKLGKTEFDQTLLECEKMIAEQGKIKILVLTENFSGWGSANNWEDMSFAERNDANVEKIAIVCEPRWEDLIDAFTVKDLRRVTFEYFLPAQEAKARQWLNDPG
ncbi:MAG: hypothetical protein COA99_10575 [Moraxellaceae bacterium]|nr:MAG: hypothetical protein COA99_10575 [Moraxellaceae bacterium]